MFKVRISNSTLNSYGTRVLTEGLETAQFERNPVLLYMHNRGQVIGCVRNIAKEGDDLVGELDFDEATDLSIQCRKQFEFGSLKAVSAGIDIIELSESPELLVQGQTGPTITRSELFEVSVVDIGANNDALVLRHGGVRLTLGKDSANPLPQLNQPLITHTHITDMELSKLTNLLGLSAESTETDVENAITTLLAERDTLRTSLTATRGEVIAQQLAALEKEGRITAEQKEKVTTFAADHSIEDVQTMIALFADAPAQKQEQFARKDFNLAASLDDNGSQTRWKTLSEVPEKELLAMRENDREQYVRLYRAEYGFDPSF